MNHLTVRTKILASFAVLAALALVVALTGLQSLRSANEGFRGYRDGIGHMELQAGQLAVAARQRAIAVRNMVLVTRPADAEQEYGHVQVAHRDVGATLAALQEAAVATADPRLREQLARVAAVEARYGPVALRIVDEVRSGQREQAVAAMNDECRPLLSELDTATRAFMALTHEIEAAQIAQAESDHALRRNGLIGTSLLAVLLAWVAGVWLSRSVTQSLSQAVSVAEAVAEGDLTQRIEVRGRDEFAQLQGALQRMTQGLAGLVTQVRQSSEAIAAGSGQIAAGNADLSHRTEAQASNLQETAASMEQMSATVRQNAETARTASDLAAAASGAASHGGEVVNQVVATMEEISSSSRKISDIIGVIDGIAFQTNILALNAAVEAARAGEQGRGFAVVASEVRLLAQRSANAAREIKGLIVGSVDRVEAGSRHAVEAGAAMADIVAQVRHVADLITEIGAASQEQTQGIGQIGVAIQQIDQTTQQNAALVEQASASANSLAEQARRMAEVVGVFRVAA